MDMSEWQASYLPIRSIPVERYSLPHHHTFSPSLSSFSLSSCLHLTLLVHLLTNHQRINFNSFTD
ncbi:hypothetical protein HanXRQr2_Chr03g0131391 [Helianthus annuus]|uniref:Uncharacterized protein n=2 Tax=Helianthus annuus TaxID=4232 RepID=A0A9K3NXZ8_HELAN|nr:hypothetical protein HanXRQr2_Chr03g0131391 [Helianthus annuus]KAJ0602710.1 hypothetical protein HanIR_Chr03g0142751 [Helianthus annuus]KAJ0945441.1 hypothetical protein HanPSC8_Chr03g0128191 [Helianthus annuus]